MKNVKFEIIRSDVNSWQNLLEQAANLATAIGPERVINVSHSSDNGDSVVCVWYWVDEDTDVLGLRNVER